MERLTKREGKHTVRIGNEWRRHDRGWDKLAEYEDLEEQGLLLRLPCKVGSELYDITEFVEEYDYAEIFVVDASRIEISRDEKGLCYCIDSCDFREKHFGTVLFNSMEEAEAALEKMGSNE